MNLKVLFVAFLCLFSTSIICNVATIIMNSTEGYSYKASKPLVYAGYLFDNETEPSGDDRGGGWPR